MNNSKYNFIINVNNIPENIYTYKRNQVNNFYEHAAKELELIYKKDGNKHLFYKQKVKIGEVRGLLPRNTSKVAFNICKDKFKTENLLTSLSIPTLKSELFYEDEKQKALDYIKNSNVNNFVLKPLSLAGGKGIELNVSLKEFSQAWENSIKIQKDSGVINPCCAIQPYIDGFDVRISITEGFYSCALLRIPAHVIGDGKSTIRDLIEAKNSIRKSSLYFKRFQYKFDKNLTEKLESQDLNLESILDKNDLVFLNDLGNLTAGAESIDITNQVGEGLIDIAMRATAAIPGLSTAGVDILTNDFNSNEGFVSEVNTNANHQVHHLPYKGDVQKPFKDIMLGMLMKYKLRKGLRLDKEEREKKIMVEKFNRYRSEYYELMYRNITN